MMLRLLIAALLLVCALPGYTSEFSGIPTPPTEGDKMLDAYFARETAQVMKRTEELIENTTDWAGAQGDLRRELFEMLGLDPMPERSDLKAQVTGATEKDGVIVENILFQSSPSLYVTANFYRPAKQDGPLPTILYVCGHGGNVIDGVSYGNKTTYQHHGTWFAKNGFTCLIIDTLGLGEIPGVHHGTHHLNRWWWNDRGYTPAGVEAWNGIRALDYLETRPEVDKEKFGLTGRSGGGAYTLWIAALDERIKCAALVAGVTSMADHVVEGCVEGHCDCMYMLNTYRWDFPLVTSLIAPRSFMILNTDKDRIFPLDGVVDVYLKTRKVYEAMNARNQIGFAAYEGPHLDTQPLRVSAFHWLERQLKGLSIRDEIADTTTPKIFTPQELKVLKSIPKDEKNSTLDETFTHCVAPNPDLADSPDNWAQQKEKIRQMLDTRVFHAWPSQKIELEAKEESQEEKDGIAFSRWSFQSQAGIRLPLFIARPASTNLADVELIRVEALDDKDWSQLLACYGQAFPKAFSGASLPQANTAAYAKEKRRHAEERSAIIYLPSRGIGPTAWTTDEKEQIHIRRRFALLGQTLDSMRIWDLRRGIQAIRSIGGGDTQLWLHGTGVMGGDALHVALYEENIDRLILQDLPDSYHEGPELLNVLRFAEIPQIVAMAGEGSAVEITTSKPEAWKKLQQFSQRFSWPEGRLKIQAIEKP